MPGIRSGVPGVLLVGSHSVRRLWAHVLEAFGLRTHGLSWMRLKQASAALNPVLLPDGWKEQLVRNAPMIAVLRPEHHALSVARLLGYFRSCRHWEGRLVLIPCLEEQLRAFRDAASELDLVDGRAQLASSAPIYAVTGLPPCLEATLAELRCPEPLYREDWLVLRERSDVLQFLPLLARLRCCCPKGDSAARSSDRRALSRAIRNISWTQVFTDHQLAKRVRLIGRHLEAAFLPDDRTAELANELTRHLDAAH